MKKFWNLEPANELLSEREPNEAYLVKNEDGSIVFIYFPYQGDVTFNTESMNLADKATIDWLDITYAKFHDSKSMDLKGRMKITAPLKKGCVAVIRNS